MVVFSRVNVVRPNPAELRQVGVHGMVAFQFSPEKFLEEISRLLDGVPDTPVTSPSR